MKKVWLSLALGTMLAMSLPGAVLPVGAQAGTFTPEVDIPGQFSGDQTLDNDLFGRYVRAIYIYFIWVVGIIATFMVVYAGVKWVGAAGNQARIRDARDTMNNAIIGVVIGLTSVVLLNLLSPSFTTLSIPGTTPVTKQYFDGAAVTRVCDPKTDGDEAQLQCGSVKVIGQKEDSNGKMVNEYCLGTVCNARHICRIQKNGSTGYYAPDAGCVTQVGIENPSGEFQPYTTMPVNFNSGFGPACGVIQRNRLDFSGGNQYSVGFACENNIRAATPCYMVGNKAKILDATVQDKVSNMACPPTNL